VLRRLSALLPLVALIAAVVVIAGMLSRSGQRDVTTGLVHMCIVIGLYSFIGVTGVFSFGHVAFVAVGAYVAGVLAIPALRKEALYEGMPAWLAGVELDPVLAVLVGGVAAAALAGLLAPSLSRISGLSAALATFALLVIVQVVARNYEPVTRGTKGMLGVPAETTLETAALWAIAFLVVVYLFQTSRVGLQLRAAREDDVASKAIGVHVGRLRGVALVLSAFLVGIAGGVYGQLLGSFNPDVFYLDLTFLTLAMLVVGGMRSLSGAVIGALALTFLSQVLREIESLLDVTGLTQVSFAVLVLLILVLRPSGITGGREVGLLRRWDPDTFEATERRAAPLDEADGAAQRSSG